MQAKKNWKEMGLMNKPFDKFQFSENEIVVEVKSLELDVHGAKTLN